MDDATRARLEIEKQLAWVGSNHVGPAGDKPVVVLDYRQARALLAAQAQVVKRAELLHAHMKALEIDLEMAKAAQAQAAAVLAAALAWHDAGGDDVEAEAIFWDAVVDWRAAREG